MHSAVAELSNVVQTEQAPAISQAACEYARPTTLSLLWLSNTMGFCVPVFSIATKRVKSDDLLPSLAIVVIMLVQEHGRT